MAVPKSIRRIADSVWEVPLTLRPGMRVPVRICATEALLHAMDDQVFTQAANVATLPGIVGASFVMPDAHWGYGFPIGGVAAMDPATGVISPGGIGFDINCGMRLVLTDLTLEEVQPKPRTLIDLLYERVPTGVGCRGFVKLSQSEFAEVLERGAGWCVRNGYGTADDLARTEEHGCLRGADASCVSPRAIERGYQQIGTLGSGNHYLEIQVARPEHVVDAPLAAQLGITQPNQIAVMFHCGSRGFGHQVASDYLQIFLHAMKTKYGLEIIDRELACAPFMSDEGQRYFAAMQCAANMSFANRQVILHRIREVFGHVFGRDPNDLGLRMVYDVAHNTAKLEDHVVDGTRRQLLVHRKGATRAFGPGMAGLPPEYQQTGQPVIIGGSMETGSYLLTGLASGADTFFSTAHGSGRTMSRTKAKKSYHGRELQRSMEARGIYVRTASYAGLAEEAGGAYKDIDAVVEATERAGLSHGVVRFTPIGNVKG
ncbi:MAG: RtcB family protein [Deltaproteobacteria bacterium]|nr:RtcB family protein [Deltaproteobacteria bacterium]MBI3388922.1 RtcB family protein [Deltaproteobacteria bacterium]